jgi:hypothetical protein
MLKMVYLFTLSDNYEIVILSLPKDDVIRLLFVERCGLLVGEPTTDH